MLIVDGHEDLSMGALADGRDYLSSAEAIRRAEAEAGYANRNGIAMLGLANWLAGRIAVVVATIQTIPRSRANPGELSYATIEGAHQQALAHLDLYRRWADSCPQIELVENRDELQMILDSWSEDQVPEPARQVGLVLLMENADPIRRPTEVGFWAERGVRLIGPAWHANRYTPDTNAGGPLTPLGRELLREMGAHRIALDLTHMAEEACLEAIDSFDGALAASHAHSRRTANIPRLLSDAVIAGIVARDGIVGVLPLNWALDAGWRVKDGKEAVNLEAVVDAIDAICQIAGDAGHVGIGSDFDGGQGAECAPAELDTIADLPQLAGVLAGRGFTATDVAGVMGQNWLRFLRGLLP